MIYRQRERNIMTSRVIVLGFGATVLFILYVAVVLIFGGDLFWFALVLAAMAALMAFGYLKSDRWVLRRFTSQFIEPSRKARELLEQMAIAAGIKTPVLYVLDTGTLNAFAVGREPDKGIVVITKGLVDKLEPDELRAVIAHEVAHIRDGDSMAGSIIALVVWAANRLFVGTWYLMYLLARMGTVVAGQPLLVLLPVASFLLPTGGRMAQMAFSRTREYLADNSAVLLTRDPESMITALMKLDRMSTVVLRASRATSHLFVASTESIWNVDLLSTHPPLEKRIERLRHVTAVPVHVVAEEFL
ncbi:MAG: hypothetical protein C4521_03670 [Actinobacteria bacterium]|nr:MAG: hypothetical protein C4521_03670 [Actinomycetota bacterium]